MIHLSVMTKEVEQYLELSPGKIIVDATLGMGGHSLVILKKITPGGRLIGIDQDMQSIYESAKRLREFKGNFALIQGNFADLTELLEKVKISQIDGILFDLGISSDQLESRRGFSYQSDVPLDMRIDQGRKIKAAHIINQYDFEGLRRVFKEKGEEPFASKIAQKVLRKREQDQIRTTFELRDIIKESIPTKYRARRKIHFATNIFRALRMEVNQELEALRAALPQTLEVLKPGSRIVVISFHSLEDRIVKNFFRQESRDCICPPGLPICQCHHQAKLKTLTKKPVLPSQKEALNNSRSRSAKLRAAEKL